MVAAALSGNFPCKQDIVNSPDKILDRITIKDNYTPNLCTNLAFSAQPPC